MLTSSSPLNCTECGAPVRGSVGLGLCSACALRCALGLPNSSIVDPGSDSTETSKALRFGDYDLLAELARGGMGVVYRARQRSLDRTVALKVLLGGAFAGEDGKRRLLAEAAAAGRLQHPNIVAVHDAGVIDGQPFFSMALVEGPTLADLSATGPMAPARAARLVASIAEAVHYAHTQGVLHRDLKPSNVLLDTNEVPLVTDFGLARPLGFGADGAVPGAQLTVTGQVLGSPAYMSPEQATGRSADLRPASDVYSLGAILFELLTGRPPFLGESAHTVIEQVKTLEPIPLRRLRPGVPRDLETVCLKCLEKDPRRRYATAQQLVDELQRFLRGDTVRARPVGPTGRAWRWAQRHRALALSSVLVVVLLVGGAVGALIAAWRIQRAERVAVAALRESLMEQARGRRLAGGLGVSTETIGSLRRASALGLDENQRQRARTEAIAALAMDEVRFVPLPQLPRSPIFRSAIDPTFRWFAQVESNNILVVRQIDQGRLMWSGPAEANGRVLVGQPEFSGDGNYVAVKFRDGFDIWCVTNGQRCFSNPGATNVFAFAREGRSFALAQADGAVTLRELPSGAVRFRLAAGLALPTTPTTDARRLSLSNDGRRVAVVQARTNCVDVFSFQTGERVLRVAGGMEPKNTAWSRDDTLLAVACGSGSIQVWDARTGELQHHFGQGNAAARCLAFHPRAALLAEVSPQRSLTLRRLITGRLLAEVSVDASDVVFNDDGSRLGPVWMGGQIGWLETTVSSCFRTLSVGNPQSPYWHVSFSPEGGVLAVCSRQEMAVLDVATLTSVAGMTNRSLMFARFDPLGFLWTLDAGGVHRWRPGVNGSLDLALSKMETRWTGREWRWLDFSADGRWMAAASRDLSRLVVSPLSSGTNLLRVGPHRGARMVALDRVGRHAVSGSLDDKRLKVWDVAENRLLVDLPAGGRTGGAAFSPDGRWLATLGEEGHLWSVGRWTNAAATLFPSGETGLGDGVFSADSRWLAVVANLREIHFFDVTSARRLAVFQAPDALGVQALALSPDGRWIVALCQDGWLQRWDLRELRRELVPLDLGW